MRTEKRSLVALYNKAMYRYRCSATSVILGAISVLRGLYFLCVFSKLSQCPDDEIDVLKERIYSQSAQSDGQSFECSTELS